MIGLFERTRLSRRQFLFKRNPMETETQFRVIEEQEIEQEE